MYDSFQCGNLEVNIPFGWAEEWGSVKMRSFWVRGRTLQTV